MNKVGIILNTMYYIPERLNYKQLEIRANTWTHMETGDLAQQSCQNIIMVQKI